MTTRMVEFSWEGGLFAPGTLRVLYDTFENAVYIEMTVKHGDTPVASACKMHRAEFVGKLRQLGVVS